MLTFGLTLMSAFSVLLILTVTRLFHKPYCGGLPLIGIVVLGYAGGIVITLIGIVVEIVSALL